MSAIYNQADFQNVVLTVLACVVLIIGVGCLYSFIRAIILFVFSGSKDDSSKDRSKGLKSIQFMIVGALLSLLLLFCIPTVLRAMNVPSYDTYTPKRIFVRAGELLNYVVKLGNVVKKSQESNQYQGQPYYNPDSSSQQTAPSTSSTNYQL